MNETETAATLKPFDETSTTWFGARDKTMQPIKNDRQRSRIMGFKMFNLV